MVVPRPAVAPAAEVRPRVRDPAARRDPAPALVAVHEGGQAALRVVVAEVLHDVDLAAGPAGIHAVHRLEPERPVLAAHPVELHARGRDAVPEAERALRADVTVEAVGMAAGDLVAPADPAPGGGIGVLDDAEAHGAAADAHRTRVALGARTACGRHVVAAAVVPRGVEGGARELVGPCRVLPPRGADGSAGHRPEAAGRHRSHPVRQCVSVGGRRGRELCAPAAVLPLRRHHVPGVAALDLELHPAARLHRPEPRDDGSPGGVGGGHPPAGLDDPRQRLQPDPLVRRRHHRGLGRWVRRLGRSRSRLREQRDGRGEGEGGADEGGADEGASTGRSRRRGGGHVTDVPVEVGTSTPTRAFEDGTPETARKLWPA